MVKMCARCGMPMTIPDYYAYIATKYCKRCRADRDRERKAIWARTARANHREERKLLRELNSEQAIMIDNLRAEIIRLRELNRKGGCNEQGDEI